MTDFVLVHGGWEGGWVWRDVARLLRAHGHGVFAQSLTGLGERSHLATPEVDLETHVADVIGILDAEELSGVVLAGHSYGGMVITGVADRCADRIAALVYVDAFIAENGKSLFDMVSPERRQFFEELAAEADGWRIPVLPAADWGVTDPEHRRRMEALSAPHPVATMTQPLTLTGAWEAIPNRAYILAAGYDPSPFHKYFDAVKGDPAWRVHSLPCNHMINLEMPAELADTLLALSG